MVLRANDGEGVLWRYTDPAISSCGLSFTARDYTIGYGEEYRYRVMYLQNGESSLLFETEGIRSPFIAAEAVPELSQPFQPGDDAGDRLCPLPSR